MFYWDESWTGVRYSSSPPNMYFRLLKVFLYERSVFMLKIDNERLTDKTTILWENESGIMSTFTLRIETSSDDLGDILLELRTSLSKDELEDIKDEVTLRDSVEEIIYEVNDIPSDINKEDIDFKLTKNKNLYDIYLNIELLDLVYSKKSIMLTYE